MITYPRFLCGILQPSLFGLFSCRQYFGEKINLIFILLFFFQHIPALAKLNPLAATVNMLHKISSVNSHFSSAVFLNNLMLLPEKKLMHETM